MQAQSLIGAVLAGVCLLLVAEMTKAEQASSPSNVNGAKLYQSACATCHGAAGRGQPSSQVGFDVPLPDFTDCDFSSREPDDDWLAVIHSGGPTRGFDEMMPAFGEALTADQMQRILDYVRTFCGNDSWPRGELNLPRALLTEKAYPEDEAVLTVTAAAEGRTAITNELLWERRFGARNQIELSVPFAIHDTGVPEGTEAGVGDIAIGVKHALYHSLKSGSILSVGGEVILPSGDDARGLGLGTTVFEPFILYGQILPAAAFLQLHVLVELPVEQGFDKEVGWRAALGKTWTRDQFGRAWTPMLEVLGARALTSGAHVEWDVVPQLQVTLNTRQHVIANLGVRLPLTDASTRDTEVMLYLLWDWFDGGLLDGW